MIYKVIATFGIVAALFFGGCSQSASTVVEEEPEESSLDIYQKEFLINYVMLNAYYLYAHSRNELAADPTIYYGVNFDGDFLKSYCTAAFKDVCYMYEQMKDPYTRYFDPIVAFQVLEDFKESEELVGIGVEVKKNENLNLLEIVQVYGKSPAENAGLKEGDFIYSVDELTVNTEANFKKLSAGNIGDTINFKVIRNLDTLAINVEVGSYKMPTVFVYYKDSIPIIKITQFTDLTLEGKNTYDEFVDALKKTANAKSTIVDLRQNPGGSVDQCNAISKEFLFAGDTLMIDVSAKGSDEENVDEFSPEYQVIDTVVYTANTDGLATDRYIVFLADTASASCAEVVLSAVTVNRKFPIVGTLSYGKGIGQVIAETPIAGGVTFITSVVGIDKNKECYHDLGIAPDFEIADSTLALEKAVELAKEKSAKRSAGYGSKKLNHFSKKMPITSANKIPTLKDLKLRYKKADFLK